MSNIALSRRELLELWHGLPALAGLKGFRLGYAVARTKAKLRPEVEALEEALKPDKDYQAYEEKRLKLCHKYVQKDAQGNLAIQGGQYLFGENQEVFITEMEPLRQEYAVAIEGRKKQLDEYHAFIKEEIIVEVYQVAEADIPKDPEPTVAQMGVLYHLIKAQD